MFGEVLSSVSDLTWVLTVVIGLLTYFFVRHIQKVRSMPPGPFPLPILGNLLLFRGKNTDPKKIISGLSRKHKDMFTFWLGPNPTVFVCSWELCKEALLTKRNDFSGRVTRIMKEIMCGDNDSVSAGDTGPAWETLKKILISSVRGYSASENLAELITELVDKIADKIVKEGKPVDAGSYAFPIILNVLSSSAFGQRYDMDEPEFLKLKKMNSAINEVLTDFLPSEVLPFLRWFYRKKEAKFKGIFDPYHAFIFEKFEEHKATYQKGTVRDFTDALLAARDEAEEEDKRSLQYLTDGNLRTLLFEFFLAGMDTTKYALNWLLLFLCEHLEIQKKIQAEIDDKIGSRGPVLSDRANCPYSRSCIDEILRMRSFLEFTIEHKALCDTELNGYKIPKNTSVVFHMKSSHVNDRIWEEPESFKPERFLEPDGQYTQARLAGYFPFGLGRRACPGEKLALADVFLILTRLLQNHSVEFENGTGSVSLEPEAQPLANMPHSFKLVMKRRMK